MANRLKNVIIGWIWPNYTFSRCCIFMKVEACNRIKPMHAKNNTTIIKWCIDQMQQTMETLNHLVDTPNVEAKGLLNATR